MPPPSDKLQGIWTKTIAESSDLRDRWGGATEFPIDDKGNADIQAIRDLLSVGSGRKVSVAPQETRERPGIKDIVSDPQVRQQWSLTFPCNLGHTVP